MSEHDGWPVPRAWGESLLAIPTRVWSVAPCDDNETVALRYEDVPVEEVSDWIEALVQERVREEMDKALLALKKRLTLIALDAEVTAGSLIRMVEETRRELR